MSQERFIKFVQRLVLLIAFGVYLFAVYQVTQIALTHDNFSDVVDDEGNPVLDDDGNVEREPSEQPVIPEIINLMLTILGGTLAINFGAVIGISVRDTQQQGVALNAGGAVPGAEQAKHFIIAAGTNTLKAIKSGLFDVNPRHIAVVIYFIALVWISIVYLQDGGATSNPGTIPEIIKTTAFTAIGILGGALASIND